MSAISNYDVFENFFNYIKNPDVTIEDAVKEFGGSDLYIPSYKTTFRNQQICCSYKERLGEKNLIHTLAKEHDLTKSQIYEITKHLREPSLFDS